MFSFHGAKVWNTKTFAFAFLVSHKDKETKQGFDNWLLLDWLEEKDIVASVVLVVSLCETINFAQN
jgi:hypothetical protein